MAAQFRYRLKNARGGPRESLKRLSRSAFALGLIAIGVFALAGVYMYNQAAIETALKPGDTITMDFARGYELREYGTAVKVAGVEIGTVQSVERRDGGGARLTAKIDGDIPEKLGSAPGAAIRPAILLSGKYYVELIPGGDRESEFSGMIPVSRTTVPVELGNVVQAIQPDAIKGIRSSIGRVERTLGERGRTAFDQLVQDAPAALRPSSEVLDAMRGQRPDRDLENMVMGMNATAATLTKESGQLDAILRDLRGTSDALGGASDSLGAAIEEMPESLRTSNAGLARLETTLAKVRRTAGPARPVVTELSQFVDRANPVLEDARPVIHDLRGLLDNADPLVRDLVPTSQRGTAVLEDVRGPVMDRINGPIKKMLLSPYRGKGEYKKSGADEPFYKVFSWMWASAVASAKMTDANGSSIGFQPGIGPGAVAGLPVNTEQLWQEIIKYPNPDDKNRDTRDGDDDDDGN